MSREMFQIVSRYVDVSEKVLLFVDSNLSERNNDFVFKEFTNIIINFKRFSPGADLIKLFPLLLPLRTGRTEIKCAGTSVLAYAGVLRIPRWCRQNSHVTCSKTRWRSTAIMCKIICIA